MLKNIQNLKKIIFYSFLISYLILFFDSLIQIKTGQNILGYKITNYRVSSLFGDKLIMGSYVIKTLPILIAISYMQDIKKNSFFRILLICIAGILIFFSAERVAFFYYIMIIAVYIFLLNNKKQIIFTACLLSLVFFFFSLFQALIS